MAALAPARPAAPSKVVVVASAAAQPAPEDADGVNLRDVLNAAVVAASPTAHLHVLVLFHDDAGDGGAAASTVSFAVRRAVGHVYMNFWDLAEEHGKPLLQVTAYPVRVTGSSPSAAAGGGRAGAAAGAAALATPVVRGVLGLDAADGDVHKADALFVDAAHAAGGHAAAKFGTGTVVDAAAAAGVAVTQVAPAITAEMRAGQDIVSLNARAPAPVFANVVMGGTFDHMHAGHRQLLTMASLVSGPRGRVVVGVTSPAMLRRKAHGELIEPVGVRCRSVERFLHAVNPDTEVEVHVINDPGGPSTVDPNLQAIVVSSETVRGGIWVNNEREKKGLNRLTVLTVERSAAATCSSTYLRKYLASRFDATAGAAVLVEAWARERPLLTALADVPQPPTITEMYALHAAMCAHPLTASALGGCCGYKMGGIHCATDPATGEPVPGAYGLLVRSGLFDVGRDGGAAPVPPRTAGSVDGQNLFCMEAEVGFIMGSDLEAQTTPRSAAEVYAHVAEVRLCIEMCGRRFALALAADATTMHSLGDAMCAGGVVLGKAWQRQVGGEDGGGGGGVANDTSGLPTAEALRSVVTTIAVNGEVKSTGSGAACPLGGPVESLAFCANHLNGRGLTLRKGELVIAGACCKTTEFKVGDVVEAAFQGLGAVTCVLGE